MYNWVIVLINYTNGVTASARIKTDTENKDMALRLCCQATKFNMEDVEEVVYYLVDPWVYYGKEKFNVS